MDKKYIQTERHNSQRSTVMESPKVPKEYVDQLSQGHFKLEASNVSFDSLWESNGDLVYIGKFPTSYEAMTTKMTSGY